MKSEKNCLGKMRFGYVRTFSRSWKINLKYCSLFFLSIGVTEAILAESENEFLKRLFLIILVRCLSIIYVDIFAIITGILSGPVAFLASKLLIFFIYMVDCSRLNI